MREITTLLVLVGSILTHTGLTSWIGPTAQLIGITPFATSDDEPLVFHDRLYFVELDGIVPQAEIDDILTDLNSTEVWEEEDLNLAIWEINSFPFTTPDGETILDINGAVTRAKQKTRIRSSSVNIQQAIVAPTNATVPSCFDITDYAASQGSDDVMISILDTGISDMSDNSTQDLNYNLSSYTGYDYVNNDAIPEDEHGHGTHLTGIIHSITQQAAQGGTSNVSFDIRKTHDATGKAFMSAVIIALVEAKEAGADIINMSFSVNDTYEDSLFYPLKNAIDWLATEGILVIAAAGNDIQDNDILTNTAIPASFPSDNIISVGSIGCDSNMSSFTNWGAHNVDIATLGEYIPGPDLAQGIAYLSGTSQAAAIVTAIAGIKGTMQDSFDYQLIKCTILNSSTHYIGLTDRVATDGVLDPAEALSLNICPSLSDDCTTDLTGNNALTGTLTDNRIYETSLNINSNQIINQQVQVSYDAQQSITMGPGFEVVSAGQLQVTTDGCRN